MNKKNKIILSIGIIIMLLIIAICLISFIGKNNKTNKRYFDITSINLETFYSDITIKEGKELKVETIGVGDNVTITETGKKLIIEEEKKWFFNRNSGEIIIHVPSDLKLDELEIESSAGVVSIDGISSYDFDLDAGAGKIKISNSKFDKTEISGGAGTIDITDSILKNLELEAGVGKVNINSEIIGDSKIECGIGKINLTLLGNKENYKLIANKGIGKIIIDNIEQKNNTTYGEGINKIQITGGIGKVDIEFLN